MTEIQNLRNIENLTRPIFENKDWLVHQATDSAVPGLYKVEPISFKQSFIELNDSEILTMSRIQQQLRKGLRDLFGIELSGLYVEEHPSKRMASNTIPFHIDMLKTKFSVDVYQPYIEEYLKSYSFRISYQQINKFNDRMEEILNGSRAKNEAEKTTLQSIHNQEPILSGRESTNEELDSEEVLEVFDEKELPVAPSGKKYFVCIGGTKNFQCFLSNNTFSRGEFILSHEGRLDECLKPVYSDGQIIVRQDVKYAIPGFYIISPKIQYQSIDQVPQDIFERSMFIARDIKQGLLDLGVSRSHIYHDEKYRSPAFVHFWVLPIYNDFIGQHHLNPTIYSTDIWTYLDSFPRFSETKAKILEFNEKMKESLNTS